VSDENGVPYCALRFPAGTPSNSSNVSNPRTDHRGVPLIAVGDPRLVSDEGRAALGRLPTHHNPWPLGCESASM
jgi:hypothetical protein